VIRDPYPAVKHQFLSSKAAVDRLVFPMDMNAILCDVVLWYCLALVSSEHFAYDIIPYISSKQLQVTKYGHCT